jgi:hypothetical protein
VLVPVRVGCEGVLVSSLGSGNCPWRRSGGEARLGKAYLNVLCKCELVCPKNLLEAHGPAMSSYRHSSRIRDSQPC